MKTTSKWEKRRKRLFHIIEVGSDFDSHSRLYDYENAVAIILNLVATILLTFDEIRVSYEGILNLIIQLTVLFFIQDYIFRLWTAKYQYEGFPERKAVLKYVTSVNGLIDLFSFLPECLPFFIPGGTIAFRMLRIVRIFRLFRLNYYFDSLSVITAVLKSRKQQLISSVFIIVVLMIASSLCMYSLEHEAQPDVFENAFSGIWWATSTLLTVGYGDIYPITTLGKILGIFITFLGVGVVAIPTGIISAGFVEQYSEMKHAVHVGTEKDMQFIKIPLKENDDWVGKRIRDLDISRHSIIILIKRKNKVRIPNGNMVLQEWDHVFLYTDKYVVDATDIEV